MDALNRTAVSAYMDGTITTNTWNQIGQQTTMQDTTGITSYLYDLNQRQIAVQNPTGINLTYAFDAIDNRVTMQDIGGTTSYVYDAQSRNTVIVNPLNERTSIQYDALDREYPRVLGNGGAIFHTLDPDGNLTIKNTGGAESEVVAASFWKPIPATWCKHGTPISPGRTALHVRAIACFDGCKRAFPFDGGPDCTSKLGSKVLCAREKPPHKDMLLRHLPSLGDACMAVDNPHRYDAYPQGHSLFLQ